MLASKETKLARSLSDICKNLILAAKHYELSWLKLAIYIYIYIYVCLNALTMHGYSCAYARAIQLLLYEFAALQHRGCQASDLGKALAQALKCTACFVYFAFFFVPDTKSGGPSCMGGCRRPQTLLDY
jgi:DNA phosphorothioation-dependent restriction protein DptG